MDPAPAAAMKFKLTGSAGATCKLAKKLCSAETTMTSIRIRFDAIAIRYMYPYPHPIAVDRRQREVNVVNAVKVQSAQQCSNAAS